MWYFLGLFIVYIVLLVWCLGKWYFDGEVLKYKSNFKMFCYINIVEFEFFVKFKMFFYIFEILKKILMCNITVILVIRVVYNENKIFWKLYVYYIM